MKSWYTINAKADKKAEISIHDEIGFWGISAQQFMKDLKALGDIDEISLSIHSEGGDVLDGLAIYNSLKNHKATVHARIEGLAASMASVIAMAADTIEMPENAYMMVHNPWGFAVGDAEDMRQTADLLDKMRGSLIGAYRNKTGLTDDAITALLDAETWMNGTEAKEKGFIDVVTDVVALSASVRPGRYAKAPQAVVVEENSVPKTEEETVETLETATPEAPAPAAAPATAETVAKGGLVERAFAALTGSKGLQAKVTELEASLSAKTLDNQTLTARIAELEPKAALVDQLEARLSEAESNQKSVEEEAAIVAASVIAAQGFEQAKLPPVGTETGDIIAQYEAITDPGERQTFFNKNEKALRAAYAAKA